MKKLLCTTAFACALLAATAAMAGSAKAPQSALYKASYALPEDDGDNVRDALHEADRNNQPLEQKIAYDNADLYDIVTAPHFDRNAFLIKTQDIRHLQEQMKINRDDAFVMAMEQLPQEERITYANALENAVKGSASHKHKKASHQEQ